MDTVFWLLIGLGLGVVFLVLTKLWKLSERFAFAVGLISAALVYLGFGVADGANSSYLIAEACGVGIYGAISLLGLRYSLWWLALGWGIHPVWDVGIHLLSEAKTFSPAWYAILCIGFDLVVANS
jgi:hypothetical protein